MHFLHPLELLKEFGIALGAPKLVDLVKGLFSGTAKQAIGEAGADAAKNYVRKKLYDEHRDEFWAFLRGLAMEDPDASRTLFRRWADRQLRHNRRYGDNKPYGPLDEDVFEKTLVRLYRSLGEKGEMRSRNELFAWLGNMSDEQFDTQILMLQNGHLSAHALAAWEAVDPHLGKFADWLETLPGARR